MPMNNFESIETDSFIANLYTVKHFRMIGLIDVRIKYSYGIEKVTLSFYSSSGTNNGKTKGLWYPIVGIKLHSGPFTEFSPYINTLLTKTTSSNLAYKGWLAKSLFFYERALNINGVPGFSSGKYYEELLNLGLLLEDLYDKGEFHKVSFLNPTTLNNLLYSPTIYMGNTHSQVENFNNFIGDIFIRPL